MTFAQALARIEELLNEIKSLPQGKERANKSIAIEALLPKHADSIVQLGKIADRMNTYIEALDGPLTRCGMDYNKLMKGDNE